MSSSSSSSSGSSKRGTQWASGFVRRHESERGRDDESEEENDDNEEDDDIESGLYVVPDDNRRMVVHALGIYARPGEGGTSVVTEKGVLPLHPSDDDPVMVAADEQDITAKVNRGTGPPKPALKLQLGVKWDNGECVSLVTMMGIIIEWRKNLNVPTKSKIEIQGKQTTYGVTYVSVGIPEERWHWIEDSLREIGLNLKFAEKDQVSDGYVFINAGIPDGPFLVDIVSSTKTKRSLLDILQSTKKSNIIGIGGLDLSLRRSASYEDDHIHFLSATIRAFQLMNITKLSSPPLVKVSSFTPVAAGVIDPALQRLLSSQSQSHAVSGRSVPKRGDQASDARRDSLSSSSSSSSPASAQGSSSKKSVRQPPPPQQKPPATRLQQPSTSKGGKASEYKSPSKGGASSSSSSSSSQLASPKGTKGGKVQGKRAMAEDKDNESYDEENEEDVHGRDEEDDEDAQATQDDNPDDKAEAESSNAPSK